MYVNASVAALVALRGLSLPLDPNARLDRTIVRDIYNTPVSRVASVTTSRREGRRYVHLRIEVDDIRRLGEAAPFAWSTYRYLEGDTFEFGQHVQASAGKEVGNVGWGGDELSGCACTCPARSQTTTHLRAGSSAATSLCGNSRWRSAVKGTPLEVQARMEKESILFRTLALFGAMGVLVVFTFIAAIWFVKSRKPVSPSP